VHGAPRSSGTANSRGIRQSTTDLIGVHEYQNQRNNLIIDRRKLNNLNELTTLNADHHSEVDFKMSRTKETSTTRKQTFASYGHTRPTTTAGMFPGDAESSHLKGNLQNYIHGEP